MNTTNQTKDKTRIFWLPLRFWGVLLLIILLLLLAYDIFMGGNLRMYSTWIGCGQKPVAVLHSGFSISSSTKHDNGTVARVPYYDEPYILRPLQPRNFYCSAREAEKHGYSANMEKYEFRHTNPDERDMSYPEQRFLERHFKDGGN